MDAWDRGLVTRAQFIRSDLGVLGIPAARLGRAQPPLHPVHGMPSRYKNPRRPGMDL